MTYINFRDHRNTATDIVADTSSPVITELDGEPISVRGNRPCFKRFLLCLMSQGNKPVSRSARD